MTVAAEGDNLCSQAGSRERNVWPQPWITAQGNSTPIRRHWGRSHWRRSPEIRKLWFLFFFFSLSWIALARTYYTMLNNSDKNGHRFLCLDIGGKVYSFLTLTVMLAVSRHIWPFLCWNTSVPSLFNLNGCWILSKAFSVSIEMIQWFLFFILLIWLLKSSLQPHNKSHLILLVYDLFNVFLNLVC